MAASILLVEDNKLQKLTTERTLHKAGYTVWNAAEGEQALSLAREKTPDLILLDMLLPGMRGPEILERLKQDSATAHIPVVVLSSLPRTNSAKLRTAGATDYFEKAKMFKDAEGEAAFLELVQRVLGAAKPSAKSAVSA